MIVGRTGRDTVPPVTTVTAQDPGQTLDRLPAGGVPGFRVRPLHCAVVVLLTGFVWAGTRPVADLDTYWHVVIGRQILTDRSLSGLGLQWLDAVPRPWSTSEWLSETVMAMLTDRFGWTGLVAGRVVVHVVLLVLLAVMLVGRRAGLAGCGVWLLAAAGLSGAVEERPQSVSLLFLCLLAWACVRLWTRLAPPSPVAVAATSVVWAQLHGLWVLAPVAFLVVAAGLASDQSFGQSIGQSIGRSNERAPTPAARRALRGSLVAAVASCAGVLNPIGVQSFVLPFRLRPAAGLLVEWHHTALDQLPSVAWALIVAALVAAWVAAWAAGRAAPPRAELVWVAVWTVFGCMAYRNTIVAIVLLAPVLHMAVERAWGARLNRLTPAPGAAEARRLAWVAGALVVCAVVMAGAAVQRTPALARADVRPLAQVLARHPGPVRVFTDYNASGQLIAFGGGTVVLEIDGRFDLWGASAVRRVRDAILLGPQWEPTVAAFRPDAFVLRQSAPLATLLTREGRWRVADTSGTWVLLLPAA